MPLAVGGHGATEHATPKNWGPGLERSVSLGPRTQTLPSRCWRPQVCSQGVGRAGSCWGSGRHPCLPLLLAVPAVLVPPGR